MPRKKYLFDDPKNVKRVLVGLYSACALLFVLDFLFLLFPETFHKHAHYAWENWPGFYAVYGFVSCVFLVLLAKHVLRPLVKRSEDYYDR
ncbi:MAG: hypothetical protein D6681_16940 [Calditrichaeota bacterium]|nr:MAG: hypothetical protein D6681_16940 [Calditrichota bacterium]